MANKSWKNYERRVAAKTGGKRKPHDGSRAGADVVQELFLYQCKLGYTMPNYMIEWLQGIVAIGSMTDRIGVVVWKPRGALDDNAVVLLRFKDWVALHGDAPRIVQNLENLTLAGGPTDV